MTGCLEILIPARRLPLRVAVELLSSRVNQLCLFIRENGLEAPAMPEEKNTALMKVLDILGLNEVNQIFTQSSGSVKDGSSEEAMGLPAEQPQLTANNHESVMTSIDLDLGLGLCITPPTSDVQNWNFPTSPTGTLGSLFEIFESTNPITVNDPSTEKDATKAAGIENLIDELSERVGTLHIGPGGQPHFYGPTSTFNLADAPIVGDLRKPTLDGNIRKGLEADEEIPVALEEHLINLYFSWQDPSSHVVDREMFEDAKEKWQSNEDTQFYSAALHYAV